MFQEFSCDSSTVNEMFHYISGGEQTIGISKEIFPKSGSQFRNVNPQKKKLFAPFPAADLEITIARLSLRIGPF